MSDGFNPIWGQLLSLPNEEDEKKLNELCALYPQVAFGVINRKLNSNGFLLVIDRLTIDPLKGDPNA